MRQSPVTNLLFQDAWRDEMIDQTLRWSVGGALNANRSLGRAPQ